jgi:NADH-quinone oxidoreductase subunit H
LILPGFLFSVLLGMLLSYIDRKLTARLQYRQGPPWYQPLADIVKLLGKETLVPEGAAKWVFLGAPLVGLAAAALVATILWQVNLSKLAGFAGDLIVVLYLLFIPAIATILGGSASRNPISALGASREMKLVLAYELPFILAVLTVAARSKSLVLANILGYQAAHAPAILSISGLIAFLVALLAVQAKLGFVPFDIAEAEQELAAGPYLEYSGPALAVYKLTRLILLSSLPLLLVTLFMGGLDAWFILKYLLVLVLIVLIKNTSPRLRIDQALKFFWGPLTILAIIGFVLSAVGW